MTCCCQRVMVLKWATTHAESLLTSCPTVLRRGRLPHRLDTKYLIGWFWLCVAGLSVRREISTTGMHWNLSTWFPLAMFSCMWLNFIKINCCWLMVLYSGFYGWNISPVALMYLPKKWHIGVSSQSHEVQKLFLKYNHFTLHFGGGHRGSIALPDALRTIPVVNRFLFL